MGQAQSILVPQPLSPHIVPERQRAGGESQPSGSTSTVAGGLNLPWLDALRGWAIVLVVLIHSSMNVVNFQALGHPLPGWGEFGQRGVQLFYLISAFTLMLSLDHAPPQHSPLRNFYLRRFFRIAPLFYAVVILDLVFIRVTHRPSQQPLNLALGLVFLNGLRPSAINTVVIGGWSIAVEMTFYLILPFLYPYLRTVGRALLASAVSAAVLFPLSVYLSRLRPDVLWKDYCLIFWFPVELPVFLLGLALYAFWKNQFTPWMAGQTLQRRKLVSLGLLLVAPICLLLPGVPQLYTASLAFCPVILALGAWPWGLLQNRWTIALGRQSYSMYLLHFFVIEVCGYCLLRIFWHGQPLFHHLTLLYPNAMVPVFMCCILLLTFPVALTTQRLIEKPGMALGRRIIAALERRDTGRHGPATGYVRS
jgi:peptidoglycan/LPS O-acetylase OafA/YrhL